MIKRAVKIAFGAIVVATLLKTYSLFKYNPIVIVLESFWLDVQLAALHRRGR